MLDVESDHEHSRKPALQFFLQSILLVGIVSVAKHLGRLEFFSLILDDVDSSEGNHAAVEGGVSCGLDFVLCNNAKRSLVTVPDGIHLMTA